MSLRLWVQSTVCAAWAACLVLLVYAPSATAETPSGPQLGAWGVDLTDMDRNVKPGDDFYMYVNGLWHERVEIPADKTAAGPSVELQELAFEQAKTLLEEAAADTTAAKGSDRQKLGDWYASMLDEARLQALGIAPLQPDLDRVAAIATREQLARELARNNGGLGATPIATGVGFDRKQVDQMLVEIGVSGLSMPAREYYLEAAAEPLRKLHREHMARMLALAGVEDGEAKAARIQALETRMAEVFWSRTELRDPEKKFNPTPSEKLDAIAPGIDWTAFLSDAGVGAPDRVNLTTPSSITGMAKLVAETPLEDWRDYLTYHLLRSAQGYLAKPLRDEAFAFYGKILGGQPEPDPRWKEALFALGWDNRPLSDTLGKAFVARYVPDDARPQAQALIDNIIAAFDARLAKLEWMTPETRAGAREKLSKFTIKAIYPDVWQGADGLDVVRGDALGNARRGIAFLRQRDLSWLQEPPDRRIFFKTVFQVNAYANPVWNEIVFLAAIVRPPFFDPKADAAVNYGAMGAVIGHEVSHLFDDQGRKTDGDGLLRDWWTDADAKQFVDATEKLAAQVGSYEALPGKRVNGHLTLGESIGDVAGLTVAYDAYRLSLGGKEAPVLDGFTGDQRFFLAYAQMWRWKGRDAYLDQLLKTDPHPPTFLRPRTVRNIDAWYAAFDVQPGDKLYLAPEARINPW